MLKRKLDVEGRYLGGEQLRHEMVGLAYCIFQSVHIASVLRRQEQIGAAPKCGPASLPVARGFGEIRDRSLRLRIPGKLHIAKLFEDKW
jgi:hypothetical protein